jgi:hypothetical protein
MSRSVTPTLADQKFEKALEAHLKSYKQLTPSLMECILITARQLIRVARLFRRDALMDRLVESLGAALASDGIDQTHLISNALDGYASAVDRSVLDFSSPTPKAHLLIAVLNLQEALGLWTSSDIHDLSNAHGDTVRSRSSLNAIDVSAFHKGRG